MSARPRAVLVTVHRSSAKPEAVAASLKELERLCDTLGVDVVGQLTQKRAGTGASNLLGEGKLQELAAWTSGPGVVSRGPRKKITKAKAREEEAVDDDELDEDEEPEEDDGAEDEDEDLVTVPVEQNQAANRRADLVVVDCELSPSQLRNLQSAAGVEVLDRTGVILEIFHRHARSREARLQVEIARLAYLAPRMREAGNQSERRGGGIGGKGAGESDVEIDRRRVRDRIAQLKRELEDIEDERGTRRGRRQRTRQVALVGYTNAGKSSLMSALTSSEIYIADQLFATLDTTIRRLTPEVIPAILVTDTVGFIRDLPHDLVASFRSTLDAAMDSALLLQVVDASDPDWRQQFAVTTSVLAEIEADDLPRRLVLNKCDRLTPEQEAALGDEFPDAWRTSAIDPERVATLHAAIVTFFRSELEEAEVFVPWSLSAAIGSVHTETEVLHEHYEDDGVRYLLRGTPAAIGRIRAAVGA